MATLDNKKRKRASEPTREGGKTIRVWGVENPQRPFTLISLALSYNGRHILLLLLLLLVLLQRWRWSAGNKLNTI